jgi:hypothetical protein
MCSLCSLQGRFGVRLRCRGFRKGFHLLIANSMGVIPTGTQGLPGRQPRLPGPIGRSSENSIYVFCQHHDNSIPRNTSTRSQASRSAAFSQTKLSKHADKSFYTESMRLGISVFFTKLYATLTNSLQNSPQAQPTFVVPITWTAINWE